MNRLAPVNKFAYWLSLLVAVIIVVLPFHAFLTVWLSSSAGHYTLARLWKEFLLVLIVLGALYLLLTDRNLLRKFFKLWLVRLILLYILVAAISAAAAYHSHSVTPKAMWYGLLVDLRFLVFFLAVLVIAARSDWLGRQWRWLLLVPALLVSAFAILQYWILPYDFLKHFGYGDSTIPAYETINHNLHHLRVASTLRGANPLGAYLILPISVLCLAFIKEKKQRLNIAVFGVGLLLALVFSFSRSAWLGALLAAGLIVWLGLKSDRVRAKIGWFVAGAVLLLIVMGLLLRNNLTYQNFVFHTDRSSKIASTSDQGHSVAFKLAWHDITHQPLGRGVGTAGPQSIYNDKPGRIAENYYLQIGQESGLEGLLLFVAICVLVAKMLYARRAEPLALVLFASFIGIALVNLLSHGWADDTLAYIWWGLAGVTLAPAILTVRHNRKDGQKIKKP
jgi:O-antigen ligase